MKPVLYPPLVGQRSRMYFSVRTAIIGAIGAYALAAFASTEAPKSGPTVTVLSGDNQTGTPGAFNAKPFDIAVWNAAGTEPLVDTNVTFTVDSGGGQLAASNNPSASLSSSLTLKTDEEGTVQAYYQQPSYFGLPSQIRATAASTEILLHTTTLGVAVAPTGTTSKLKSSNVSVRAVSLAGASFSASGNGSATQSSGANANGTDVKRSALTYGAATVILRSPSNRLYTVNTSTWAISSN